MNNPTNQKRLTQELLVELGVRAFKSVKRFVIATRETKTAKLIKNPNQAPNWELLELPAIKRQKSKAEFESWQHLNGVIETLDTNIHIKAFALDV